MRQECEEADEAERAHGEQGLAACERGFAGGAGGFAVHGVALAAEEDFADEVGGDGGGEHDDSERVGTRGVFDFFEAIENLHAGDFAVVEHEGRAQFGEGPDEDDGCASEDAWAHERQGDGGEPFPRAGAEIFGGFVECGVKVGEGGGGVEIDDGVEREGLHEDNSGDFGVAKDVKLGAEESVEGTFAAEQCSHADGADEGGQDERHEDDCGEEAFAGEFVAGTDDGQRQGDGDGGDGGHCRELEAVEQARQEARVLEDQQDVLEGEAFAAGDVGVEAAADGEEDGVDQEDQQERDAHKEQGVVGEFAELAEGAHVGEHGGE